ncbi:hypothetical protein BJ138DRAFT_1072652 [Hygrophoropsis aurantiaca]|uniref:Uncharacterized protein n=1 Tax=Hygrophoropsis aurantiaca TaxID=72124 RepID=A0ACB7ZY19_9AGAM|nr:hypothetical protein BJ138DRAFT_1072652 [Hygrophoropsis aurantiaca]
MKQSKRDNPLPVYESHPPQWLPKSHKSADIGYPGFYPPRPGQDEDILSETHVKNGFVLGQSVQNEHIGAIDAISLQDAQKPHIFDNTVLLELENLMQDIFTRRIESVPSVPASTFKIPSRVTLNDSKRQAWFADLANPDVPLHKLGKSVPHGAKGHDLLDLLQSNNVAISRAVWFLRVFGANETAGLRHKPGYNPTQYSVDWAIVVTSYMKKQLADIALPSAPRPGVNIKQTFKSVLSDADLRERWVSRFSYCLKLLRPFYTEGLVDNRTFLIWLVQQMATCNLAQVGFVARLADEYLDGMLVSRALTKPFVDACIAKLVEINTTVQGHLVVVETLLKTILQRICMSLPDVFVSPATWTAHSALLSGIFSESVALDLRYREVQRILLNNLADIQRRNDAMLFRNLPPRVLERLGSMVVDVQTLNSISSTTDLSSISFFSYSTSDSTSTFTDKLDTLLTWAVTPLQYGDHRSYAAATLLRAYRDRGRDFSSSLHDCLFDWLDTSEVAGESENLRGVATLFGKLVKANLFEYAAYVQRLVARGEEGLSFAQESGLRSRHRDFLRWMPLHSLSPSLTNQRKLLLHGARVRETPEDLCERELRREIRSVLPLLFGGDRHPMFSSVSALWESCPTLSNAPRFEQVKTFKQWLIPVFRKFLTRAEPFDEVRFLKTYSTAVELMHHTQCYGSLLDLSLLVLSHTLHSDTLVAVSEVFHRFATIWTSMNVTGTVTAALYATHLVWRTRGVLTRSLLALLVEMDDGRYLEAGERTQIAGDTATFTHALFPETDHPTIVPPVLPEILLLAEDPNPEAPSILANGLWYKYRTSLDWAWKVWDNTVASLRQIPLMTPDAAGRHACALRYGQFLLHIDQHLPGGFDDQVLQWFLGTGKGEVMALSVDAWDVFTVVILFLCVHGALSTKTVLRGLVFPGWKLGADASSSEHVPSVQAFLRAVNHLFDRLLLKDDFRISDTLAPDLLDIQRIHTRRQDVFREPHFTHFVGSVPTLVLIEHNSVLPDESRNAAKELRYKVSESDSFRQSCYRNLEAVRRAFEDPLQSGAITEILCEPLVNALKLILGDSSAASPDVNSFLSNGSISSVLSPWRLAATAIQIQFGLRQLGRALAHESTSHAASASLDKMTSMLFRHSMASEEAYFIAEMARGVDGPVAVKFVNNGFKCIIEIFTSAASPSTPDRLLECVERAGEVVRILSHVAGPLLEESPQLSLEIDIITQEKMIGVILDNFTLADTLLSSHAEATLDPSLGSLDNTPLNPRPQLTQAVIFLARLLQFELGLSGIWTDVFRSKCNHIAPMLFKLVLLHASGPCFDLVAYPLLIDTLMYIIDELSTHHKPATLVFDPFRYYPTVSSNLATTSPQPPAPPTLSDAIPPPYLTQLCCLIPTLSFPPNPTVTNLVSATRDPISGDYVYGERVLNRPWEWVEWLGTPEDPDGTNWERGVKNSASMSLDLFGARLTGDRIIPPLSTTALTSTTSVSGTPSPDTPNDIRKEGDIRAFEDSLFVESVYRRDWRDTRLRGESASSKASGHARGEEGDEVGVLPTFPQGASGSRRASPASSVRSGASISSRKPSPSVRTTSDEGSAGKKGHKRKISSDDEIEIIEGPVPAKDKKIKVRGKKR